MGQLGLSQVIHAIHLGRHLTRGSPRLPRERAHVTCHSLLQLPLELSRFVPLGLALSRTARGEMVQTFMVVRCFKCETFQVELVGVSVWPLCVRAVHVEGSCVASIVLRRSLDPFPL